MLIAKCAKAGIAEWVCCPGAFNLPLLTALAGCPGVHRWQVQDERAAAFFALGRMQATGRGVGVVLGSGANAVCAFPAVMEAFYERRPLVLVTLDDLEPADAAGAFGHIEQDGLFGLYAPTLTLHMPCSEADLPDMVDLCRDGFPVHLRLCCVEDMLHHAHMRHDALSMDFLFDVADAPLRPPFRGSLAELSRLLRFEARHENLVMLLGALDPDEQESALWLARTLRVPVVADATSGLREKVGELLLSGGSDLLTNAPPRNVLRLGAVPSCPFWHALEEMPSTRVFSITRTGFSGLRRPSTVIEGEPEQIIKALDDVPRIGDVDDYRTQGNRYAALIEELLLTYPESDAALVRAFSQQACIADVLYLGSPSTTQLWNNYAQLRAPTLYVHSAQLAGCADGALSAFMGNCVDTDFACALIGDIALLRDTAAAQFLPQLAPGKRVVAVLNNNGAGAVPPSLSDEMRDFVSQPLHRDLRDYARLLSAEYYLIRSEADFEIMEEIGNDAFALLELSPDPEQSDALRRRLP